MTYYRRSPRPLTFALESIQNELAPQTVLAEVQRIWRSAVGASIAAHATPTAERRGVLTVTCDASVWAQELDLVGPEIVGRLNALLRSDQILRLRCSAASVRTR